MISDGIPEDVKARWTSCPHHDFETSSIGMTAGVYLLKCIKCGFMQRTDATVWGALNRLETIP